MFYLHGIFHRSRYTTITGSETIPLKVVELFAGIGAQAQALENLGLDFTSIVCEIDDKAYKSYCAIHGETPNLGDITKVEHLPECDLLTYSYPCTSVSIAGKQEGMVEGSGTASSLVWEVGRLLDDVSERESLPEVLLMENVDAVLNELNIAEFRRWLAKLTSLGYTNSYKVLNAKDYGVPQNRKRIFVVSMLGGRMLDFPKPCPDGRVLRDVLEEEVPEQYYLSEEKISKFEKHKARHETEGHGFGWRPNHGEDIAYTINTKPDRANQNFIIESPICVGNIQCEGFNEMTSRVYDAGGLSPTIRTPSGGGVMPKIEVVGTLGGYEKEGRVHNPNGLSPTLNLCRQDHAPKIELASLIETEGSNVQDSQINSMRIRYLTPRECWRLMGFPDSAYEAARDVPTSKTQLYKQAGNSIAVPCLEAIFRAIYIDRSWHARPSLEAFL